MLCYSTLGDERVYLIRYTLDKIKLGLLNNIYRDD